MYRFFSDLLIDDDGATAVEYAVMLALIILVVFASVASVGTKTSTLFNNASTSMQAAGVGGP